MGGGNNDAWIRGKCVRCVLNLDLSKVHRMGGLVGIGCQSGGGGGGRLRWGGGRGGGWGRSV